MGDFSLAGFLQAVVAGFVSGLLIIAIQRLFQIRDRRRGEIRAAATLLRTALSAAVSDIRMQKDVPAEVVRGWREYFSNGLERLRAVAPPQVVAECEERIRAVFAVRDPLDAEEYQRRLRDLRDFLASL